MTWWPQRPRLSGPRSTAERARSGPGRLRAASAPPPTRANPPKPAKSHSDLRDVLAHRTPEQGGQSALDPPRVGAGQVGARDQRLHLARHPGGARQSDAAPLPRAPALGGHARPRHADLHRAERTQQLALARPVPIALRRLRIPLVAPASQRRFQLLPDQLFDVWRTSRFDKPAHPLPDARLDLAETRSVCGWVEPGVSGKQRRAVCTRLRAILFHGVVPADARTPEMAR